MTKTLTTYVYDVLDMSWLGPHKPVLFQLKIAATSREAASSHALDLAQTIVLKKANTRAVGVKYVGELA